MESPKPKGNTESPKRATELPQEYLKLGRYLWERINTTSNSDTESLKALGSITYDLIDTFEDDGFMRELDLWIGVKRDAPKDFKDYGEGITRDYPEFFED